MHERQVVCNTLDDLILEHGIDEIVVLGIPIYQMTKVGIIGNIMNSMTRIKEKTVSGTIVNKKANLEKNNIKIRSQEALERKFDSSTLFITRGMYNNEGEDVFIDDFISAENNSNIIILDRMMSGNFPPHKYDSYYTATDFHNLISVQTDEDLNLSEDDLTKIRTFEFELRKIGYTGSYINFFKHQIKKLNSEYILYKYFLQRNNVKKVYLSMGYVHIPLLKVCKELGIETIEIQYGNISTMHGGFIPTTDKEVYADKLLVWSEIYADMLKDNPSKKEIYIPKNLQYKVVEKKSQLLVIVQRIELKEFIDEASKLRKQNPNLKIIYKIHPLQTLSSSEIRKLKKHDITIAGKKEDTIQLINESKWVMSGYSTALIEANYANSIPLINHNISFSTEFDNFAEAGYMHIYENDQIEKYVEIKRMAKN